MFIAGSSSWLLIFSHIGHQIILVPLLTTASLYFVLRIARHGSRKEVVVCATIASLGLYTYAASFILPLVIFVTLLCLAWTKTGVTRGHVRDFAILSLLYATPFLVLVANDLENFFTGYIGGKLAAGENVPQILIGNIIRSLLALHVRGDEVFRSNPVFQPHLDPASGILLLLGVWFWLTPARCRLSPLLLVPLFLLQVPAILVLSAPNEVPSASRTLGIVPIAYLLVASGLWWLMSRIQRRWAFGVVTTFLLLFIVGWNTYTYFGRYVNGLPNNNTPYGRLIAWHLDSLPPDTDAYMFGCWGEWLQPEPEGVLYAVQHPERLRFPTSEEISCEWLSGVSTPAILIWNPVDTLPSLSLLPCASSIGTVTVHMSILDEPVFKSAEIGVADK